jgi:peptidoglycan hydrolase-like protein with peptidoglycan-binding domain
VVDLQSKLKTAAPQLTPPLAEDGIFGQKTFTRVKGVQKPASLVPDGAVGTQTWLLLADVIAGVVTLLDEVSPLNPFPDNRRQQRRRRLEHLQRTPDSALARILPGDLPDRLRDDQRGDATRAAVLEALRDPVVEAAVQCNLAGFQAYFSTTTCINLRYFTGAPSLLAGL